MVPGLPGGDVGLRATFADIGETVAEHLGLPPGRHGTFLPRRTSPAMPELPEVETVRRGLQPVMEGARIAAVETRRPDLRFPLPENFAERLSGRRIICARPAREISDASNSMAGRS